MHISRLIADSVGLIWIISTSTTFTVIVRREPVYKWSSWAILCWR